MVGGIVGFFLQTQFLVDQMFIRLAGNEDSHKILDEFDFV